jgi:hypothetical protein
MKGLKKNREHRYEMASSLATDIQRYLKGEPVAARPPSRLYQFRKLVQRFEQWSFAATSIAIVLILGTIGVWTGISTKFVKAPTVTMEQTSFPGNIHIPVQTQPVASTLPTKRDKQAATSELSIPTLPDGTGGQIRILSGTGSFASVSHTNKVLNVSPGSSLIGTVKLQTINLGHRDAVAPLIYTPSWGDHSTSWKLINRWIPTGQSEQRAQVSLVAPTTPGTYHIMFAVSWELTGDQVASMTDYGVGHDVWNDGNDIAELNTAQLASAQVNGYVFDNNLSGDLVYRSRPIPADAITVIVTTSNATSEAAPNPNINSGLVAYYPLDGNANDESGNERNGTIHGNLTFVPGISGQAAHFDGSTAYISVADQPDLRLQPPFTLSAWVKPEGPGRILHKQGYELSVEPTGTEQTIGCILQFQVWVRPLVMDAVDSSALGKGTWHYVVAVHDGFHLSLYINGKLKGQTPAEQPVPQSTSDLNIGRNGYTGRDRFRGDVEEVRIYTRVLSSTEIAQLASQAQPVITN